MLLIATIPDAFVSFLDPLTVIAILSTVSNFDNRVSMIEFVSTSLFSRVVLQVVIDPSVDVASNNKIAQSSSSPSSPPLELQPSSTYFPLVKIPLSTFKQPGAFPRKCRNR